jgi:hypothetical protein
MMIIVGSLMIILGTFLFSRVLLKDRVGVNKFNFEYKIRRNIFIFTLLIGGLIIVARELILTLMR